MTVEISIPDYWETTERDADKLLTLIAEKYVGQIKTKPIIELLKDYSKEVVEFINSPSGQSADCSTKEVIHRIIDFMSEISIAADSNLVEEDIIVLWQDIFFGEN